MVQYLLNVGPNMWHVFNGNGNGQSKDTWLDRTDPKMPSVEGGAVFLDNARGDFFQYTAERDTRKTGAARGNGEGRWVLRGNVGLLCHGNRATEHDRFRAPANKMNAAKTEVKAMKLALYYGHYAFKGIVPRSFVLPAVRTFDIIAELLPQNGPYAPRIICESSRGPEMFELGKPRGTSQMLCCMFHLDPKYDPIKRILENFCSFHLEACRTTTNEDQYTVYYRMSTLVKQFDMKDTVSSALARQLPKMTRALHATTMPSTGAYKIPISMVNRGRCIRAGDTVGANSPNTLKKWTEEENQAKDETLRSISEHISQYKSSVTTIFRQFDKDCGGEVSGEELRKGLQNIGLELSDREFAILFEHIDKDGDKQIQYEEFLTSMEDYHKGRYEHRSSQERFHREARAGKKPWMAGPGLADPGIFLPEYDMHRSKTMRAKHFARKCYSVLDTSFHPQGRENENVNLVKHLGFDETLPAGALDIANRPPASFRSRGSGRSHTSMALPSEEPPTRAFGSSSMPRDGPGLVGPGLVPVIRYAQRKTRGDKNSKNWQVRQKYRHHSEAPLAFMSRSKSFERGVRRQGIQIMKTVMPMEEIKRIRSERTAARWKVAQDDMATKAEAAAAAEKAAAEEAEYIPEEALAALQEVGTPREGEEPPMTVAEVVVAAAAQPG